MPLCGFLLHGELQGGRRSVVMGGAGMAGISFVVYIAGSIESNTPSSIAGFVLLVPVPDD